MKKAKQSQTKRQCNVAYSFQINKYVLKESRTFCRENHITLPALITLMLKEVSMPEIDRLFRDSEEAISQLIVKKMQRNSKSYWGYINSLTTK